MMKLEFLSIDFLFSVNKLICLIFTTTLLIILCLNFDLNNMIVYIILIFNIYNSFLTSRIFESSMNELNNKTRAGISLMMHYKGQPRSETKILEASGRRTKNFK